MATSEQIEQLELAAVDYGASRAKFLEANGWVRSCANPASLWLWMKTIQGVMYAFDEDAAIQFERLAL